MRRDKRGTQQRGSDLAWRWREAHTVREGFLEEAEAGHHVLQWVGPCAKCFISISSARPLTACEGDGVLFLLNRKLSCPRSLSVSAEAGVRPSTV